MKNRDRSYGYGDGVLSMSILTTATKCGYQFRMKYEDKKKASKTFSYFVAGNLVHYSIDDMMNEGITGDEATIKTYLMERYHHHFRDRFDQQLLSEIIYVQRAIEGLEDEARKRYGKPCKNIYMTNVWKQYYQGQMDALSDQLAEEVKRFDMFYIFTKPIAEIYAQGKRCLENFARLHTTELAENPHYLIEGEWRIPDTVTLFEEPFSGSIDRLITDTHSGMFIVADYKTGFGQWSLNKVANNDQFNWYAYAVEKATGMKVSAIAVWDLNRGEIITHQLRPEDTQAFLRRAHEYVKEYRFRAQAAAQGIDTIPKDMGYNSPCSFCEYLTDPDPSVKCPYKIDYEGVAR